jgi:hypothetical protein
MSKRIGRAPGMLLSLDWARPKGRENQVDTPAGQLSFHARYRLLAEV